MDQSLQTKGNIRFRAHPSNAFANPRWPTADEINAGQELEAVTEWDSFSIGVQASETTDRSTLKQKVAVQVRSTPNYGGNATIGYPGRLQDLNNLAALVYQIFRDGESFDGYLTLSIDGEIGEPGQPNSDFSYAAGDLVTVMRVRQDSWTDNIVGDERWSYQIEFVRNGGVYPYTVVSETVPVLVTEATSPAAVGGVGHVDVTVNGREYARGVNYSSSAPQIVRVTKSGILRRVSAGAAVITVSVPGTNPIVSETVEISA